MQLSRLLSRDHLCGAHAQVLAKEADLSVISGEPVQPYLNVAITFHCQFRSRCSRAWTDEMCRRMARRLAAAADEAARRLELVCLDWTLRRGNSALNQLSFQQVFSPPIL
jgi:hypothetical protein